jgi:acetyltransferase-like isoleucine patch superfamily enzyme
MLKKTAKKALKVFANYINMRQLRPARMAGKINIDGIIHFRTNNGIVELGDSISINSSHYANPLKGSRCSIIVDSGARLKIGNRVGISNSNIYTKTSITIEDDVNIGANCSIFDTDFHSLDYNDRCNNGDSMVKTAPIKIKKGAFIGASSIILKGVTIGERSIIGAGSVVTKNIPDDEIWAGNPAKHIGRCT